MGFNSAVASFQRFETLTCVGQVCQPWNAPPNDTLQPTGHTAAWLQTAPGNIKAVFYHATSPMAPLSAAYLQSGNVQGSSLVMTLVFQMKSTVLPQAAQPMLLTGVKASSPTAVPMQVVVDEGVIRTTSL
jgi:hypothetical protein